MIPLDDVLADLQLSGRSDRTLEGHRLEWLRLQRWLDEEGIRWDKAAIADLKRYTRLRADKGFSSRSNMLCSLRVLYGWAVEQGMIGISPAAGFKTPRRPRSVPKALGVEQVGRLVAALGAAEGRTAHRDRVMLLTALYAGLRAKELATLKWEDVDLEDLVIRIGLSKMNHGRCVPVHPELVGLLREWRDVQGAQGRGFVFVASASCAPLAPDRVGKIARKWSEASGVRFTAHVLRHTFATYALRRSHDLYGVSKALGHSEVRQTEIYISADPAQLRAAVNALPSLASW